MGLKNKFISLLTLAICSSAVAESVPEQQAIIDACFNTTILARELIDNTLFADDIVLHKEEIASQLSEPLPPTYNGIIAGLDNAVTMRGTANVESPSRASTELRAAVIGMWCINDTVAILNGTDTPVLQEGELQQTLVNYFETLLTGDNKIIE